MMSFNLIALVIIPIGLFSYAYAQIGSNTYLPPTTKGYSYPEPNKPFTPKPLQPVAPPPKKTPGSRPTGPEPQRPGDDHVHVPGMPYDFEYAVNDVDTSNDYSHKASSNGDVVNGEYRVALPDGRRQIVKYTADWKTGFHADVSYEGEPSYAQGPGGKTQGGFTY